MEVYIFFYRMYLTWILTFKLKEYQYSSTKEHELVLHVVGFFVFWFCFFFICAAVDVVFP